MPCQTAVKLAYRIKQKTDHEAARHRSLRRGPVMGLRTVLKEAIPYEFHHIVIRALFVAGLAWMPLAKWSYGQQIPPASLPDNGEPVGGVATAYDLSAMYDAVNPTIAKVFTDRGCGSGFLVDDRGFIATNFHVVRNSRYFAVQFANGMKYQAVVVMEDAENGAHRGRR